MIIVAAYTFFTAGIEVVELSQASVLLEPILGKGAALVFAVALLCAGIASSITAGIAGGSIFAGLFGRAYTSRQHHSGGQPRLLFRSPSAPDEIPEGGASHMNSPCI
jgi:manganese transport protein